MLSLIQKRVWVGIALFISYVCAGLPASWAAGVRPASRLAVSGHVYDKASKPLAGVVITIQEENPVLHGAATVAATNAEGAFFLNCAEVEPVLVLKYAGFQTQKLRIKVKSPVSITLYEVGTPLLPQAEGIEMVVESAEVPEVAPMYAGGGAAYQAYIKQNLRYPEAAKAKGLSGTVLVSFTVDEQGRILNPEVARGIDGLNQEALRLVSTMPWWIPGRRNGKPVRAAAFLRIRFEFLSE